MNVLDPASPVRARLTASGSTPDGPTTHVDHFLLRLPRRPKRARFPGFSIKGKTKRLIYHAGVFSSGDKDPELGDSAPQSW